MLYNSYVFIFLFLPVVLAGYYLLNHFQAYKMAILWLCLLSLFFYGFFNWSYLPIILISIIGNFFLSHLLKDKSGGGFSLEFLRKIVCTVGLLGNLGVLFYFKYYDFFILNFNKLYGTSFSGLNVLLPLGISFFTFQQISYLLDCYQGKVACYSFSEYVLFVSFFPQLIAGPIVLHNEILPQFLNLENRRFRANNFAKGLMAFSIGLAKKVLLADTLSKAVNTGFSNIESLGTINALIVMLCYTFQIYFDFSGYSDMAVGIGKFFNIDIPQNFNSPYKAKTITEFWNRWHMTLTRFFTTYIYIPLGGNRKGNLRTYYNVMIVFLVSGIWHGANWTFILWGVMHGMASVATRILKKQIDRWHPIFSWACTFLFLNITWVFFRADSISQAIMFLKQITNWQINSDAGMIMSSLISSGLKKGLVALGIGNYSYLLGILFLIIGFLICIKMKNTNEQLENFHCTFLSAILNAILMLWSVLSLSGVSEFLYWNF